MTKFNADNTLNYHDILETTKVLDRIYGRAVARAYFTNHVHFDTISLT